MHITAKPNGSPCQTIDYQALNTVNPRQTHHKSSPWLRVLSIPANTRKSYIKAFHSYHSLPLDSEQDRATTTFVTPWGCLRYKTCPQVFLSAGDA